MHNVLGGDRRERFESGQTEIGKAEDAYRCGTSAKVQLGGGEMKSRTSANEGHKKRRQKYSGTGARKQARMLRRRLIVAKTKELKIGQKWTGIFVRGTRGEKGTRGGDSRRTGERTHGDNFAQGEPPQCYGDEEKFP